MKYVLAALAVVVIAVLCAWLAGRLSFSERYDRAMKKDFEYARQHPGCSWEEAHRNREKVYKRSGL